MKIRYLLILLFVFIFGCSEREPRESEDPLYFLLKRLDAAEKANDLIYHEARKLLIEAGWNPVQSHSESEEKIENANAMAFWKKGYREVEECGGSKSTFCNFIFRDSLDNKLFVTTAGKEKPELGSYAIVTYTQVIGEYKLAEGK